MKPHTILDPVGDGEYVLCIYMPNRDIQRDAEELICRITADGIDQKIIERLDLAQLLLDIHQNILTDVANALGLKYSSISADIHDEFDGDWKNCIAFLFENRKQAKAFKDRFFW